MAFGSPLTTRRMTAHDESSLGFFFLLIIIVCICFSWFFQLCDVFFSIIINLIANMKHHILFFFFLIINKLMANDEVSIISDSTERQFNILNPRDYQHCMKELSKNENLFDLIRKGYQLKYDVIRGLQLNELQEMIQSELGSNSQFMFEQIQKLSQGESTWLATTINQSTKRDTILVYGELVDSKYNVLNIQATQIKQFDERKLLFYGLGALFAGVLAGSVTTPVAGMVVGGALLAASSVKAVNDYQKDLPDLIYGYIFKELLNKNIITFQNDCFRI